MQIGELIAGIGLKLIAEDATRTIVDLTEDSRSVRPGSAFIARRGACSNGHRYIPEAISRGAAAIITEQAGCAERPTGDDGVAWIVANRVDLPLVGRLADRFFAAPSRQLKIVGVTGTNGKTTTTFLIRHLLRASAMRCGMLTTICNDDGRQEQTADLTTPGPVELARWMARMVANGCRAAVIEVSSHALEQGRVAAVAFDVGVFTNLTQDHLDYHHTLARYATAKANLFACLDPAGWAVVNADDPAAERMLKDCPARVLQCRLESPARYRTDCSASILELRPTHSQARLNGPWGSVDLKLPLVGRHNVANALQAVAAVTAIADLDKSSLRSLEQVSAVPGRLQRIGTANGAAGPTVLVDYAHSHDALEQALLAVRPLTGGKVTVVFGCGGDRDAGKRPRMADVACRLADRVVLTSDNPRSEDPQTIIHDICQGVPQGCRARVSQIPDRRLAIAQAIGQARQQDLVLIAGKGHETYQIVGHHNRQFDDRVEAARALEARARAG